MLRRILLALLFALPVPPRAVAADVEPTFRHEPLKKLLDDLKSPDPVVRRMAANTLGMPDGSEGKGGPRPRGDLWPAMLALVEALAKDVDMHVRANSVKSLGLLMRYRGIPEKADPRAETIALAVIASLKDVEDLVRSAAAAALPTIGIDTKNGLKALTETLKHDEAKVRAAAATGAKGVQPVVDIVPALAESLRDRDSAVRLAAANTLHFAGNQAAGAVKPLIALLKDEDAKVAEMACLAIGSIGPGATIATEALVDAIADPKSPIRLVAVGTIGRIQASPELAVPTLIGALAVEELRTSANYSLATFGTNAKEALPAMMAVSRDAKGSVRPNVLFAVSQVEPNGAAFFDLLLAAMYDSNSVVRGNAIVYCTRGQSYPEMLPVLIVLFKVEVDVNLRMRIAQAFGAMGAEAKPVVPMLVELIGESETNQILRRILIRTVNAIDPQVLKPPAK